MRQRVFTVLAVFAALSVLQACSHHHGGRHGMHMRGGPDGFGGPGGPNMGPPEGAQLKQFDLDGDGNLTREELERALHVEFAKWDKDKDGFLSTIEARALNDERRKQPNAPSPVFDWNADGHIDFTEFANQWLSMFDRLDADGDGVLTEQEMMRPPMGPHGGMRGGEGGRDGPPGGRR